MSLLLRVRPSDRDHAREVLRELEITDVKFWQVDLLAQRIVAERIAGAAEVRVRVQRAIEEAT